MQRAGHQQHPGHSGRWLHNSEGASWSDRGATCLPVKFLARPLYTFLSTWEWVDASAVSLPPPISAGTVYCPAIAGHWKERQRCNGIKPPYVNSPVNSNPHMGWPAKVVLTSREGQEGMWEFCNLCIPACRLASGVRYYYFVMDSLSALLSHGPVQQREGVSDGFSGEYLVKNSLVMQ